MPGDCAWWQWLTGTGGSTVMLLLLLLASSVSAAPHGGEHSIAEPGRPDPFAIKHEGSLRHHHHHTVDAPPQPAARYFVAGAHIERYFGYSSNVYRDYVSYCALRCADIMAICFRQCHHRNLLTQCRECMAEQYSSCHTCVYYNEVYQPWHTDN